MIRFLSGNDDDQKPPVIREFFGNGTGYRPLQPTRLPMAKHDHVSAELRRRLHDRRCEPACPDLAMRISVAGFCGAAKGLAEAELGFLRKKAGGASTCRRSARL
ncbi:hypothetical protein [Cereibacter changlensis]|uniref:hypothetical protein n=1 Tax=Cereibacter changlensis TaxID=402884 RepID=UPI00200B28F9|nr:hypothetical protein [Cereibacter changlensis]